MLPVNINTLVFSNWRKIRDIPTYILFIYLLIILSTYVDQRAAYANSIVLESHTERLNDLDNNLSKLLLLASNIKLENSKQDAKIEELEKDNKKTKERLENHEKRIKTLEEENGNSSTATPETATPEKEEE
jgi:chromosome segregation ATPase